MAENHEQVSLASLDIDEDPGTDWHPRASKANAYHESGLLPDLNPRELVEHMKKPEDYPDKGKILAAEDSALTPDGEV